MGSSDQYHRVKRLSIDSNKARFVPISGNPGRKSSSASEIADQEFGAGDADLRTKTGFFRSFGLSVGHADPKRPQAGALPGCTPGEAQDASTTHGLGDRPDAAAQHLRGVLEVAGVPLGEVANASTPSQDGDLSEDGYGMTITIIALAGLVASTRCTRCPESTKRRRQLMVSLPTEAPRPSITGPAGNPSRRLAGVLANDRLGCAHRAPAREVAEPPILSGSSHLDLAKLIGAKAHLEDPFALRLVRTCGFRWRL
jgi:hypothetical protein